MCAGGENRGETDLGHEDLGSSYLSSRSPRNTAKRAAGPRNAAAPLRAGPRPALGPREPRAPRAAVELGAGAKVSSQLRPRAPRPPPTPARGLGPALPPLPGPGPRPAQGQAGPSLRFHFGGRAAAAWAGPEQQLEERATNRRHRPPATWEVALPAAAPSSIPTRQRPPT